MHIALLEDDTRLAKLSAIWLEDAGHKTTIFDSGRALINSLRRETYDVLLLDWIVPDIDGEQVLEWVRANVDWPIPVIFVTGKDEEEDIVRILLKGADDYLVKPIRPREMIARITALTRRSHPQDLHEKILERKPYRIDTSAQTITCDGNAIQLTQKEFDLMLFLFRNAGRILSRDYILENVWGHKPGMNTRTVDTHISRLRNKLGLVPENGWKLSGVYHHGYRLEQINTEAEESAPG